MKELEDDPHLARARWHRAWPWSRCRRCTLQGSRIWIVAPAYRLM